MQDGKDACKARECSDILRRRLHIIVDFVTKICRFYVHDSLDFLKTI